MGLIKSRPQSEVAAAEAAWLPSQGVLAKCPGLVEYLSLGRYEDGTPRQPSTITVFIESGRVKLSLNDRDVERSAYVTGEGLEDALKTMERHLVEGKADWRSWGGKKKR